MNEKVLILGGGGREHALAHYIGRSESVGEVFCSPGNGGTAKGESLSNVDLQDSVSSAEFCENNEIDLVVVGPEDVLIGGVVNALRSKGIRAFGPSKEAAELETSKIYSHRFMKRHDIPSPEGMVIHDHEAAIQFLEKINPDDFVIKADGIAAGKGVFLPSDKTEAKMTIDSLMLDRVLGDAGNKILFQEKLEGREASFTAICHGTKFASLPLSQDYKRLKEFDCGPNTGGMGVIAPANILSDEETRYVEDKIILPTLEGMEYEGRQFHGVLYAGLMLTSEGPQVIEFNTRFGDPEIQAILPILEEDIYRYLHDASDGNIRNPQIKNLSSALVVLAGENYPNGKSEKVLINGIEPEIPDTAIFHAGTEYSDSGCIATGGRVLNVLGLGKDSAEAIERAYVRIEGENPISFEGMQYRRDIGSNL